MWNNRASHALLVGMQNDAGTLEDSLVVPYNLNSLLEEVILNLVILYMPVYVLLSHI